jgi:phosphatidylinositol 3,5-bisphosphate 5-phosphatase
MTLRERPSPTWTRVVVCVTKTEVMIIGERTSSGESSYQPSQTTSGSIIINRIDLTVSDAEPSSSSSPSSSYKTVVTGVGIYGTIRLHGATYLGVITRAANAGAVDRHIIWSIAEIQWLPLNASVATPNRMDQKYLSLINSLFSGTKYHDFYFSDTLDLIGDDSSRFWWNRRHSQFLRGVHSSWTIGVMYGAFRSVQFSSNGHVFEFALICRRSTQFAGTRFRKRGLNWNGDCANEIETEQILVSFGRPDRIMSYTQIRGSVPLMWTQESHGLVIKPEIVIRNMDLDLSATKQHFDDVATRYGAPVHVVSLMKRDPASGEYHLGTEYSEAVKYLVNEQSAPPITMTVFDMKGAAHAEQPRDSIDELHRSTLIPEAMYHQALDWARTLVEKTGWTEQGPAKITVQKGVIRNNCVDCLDRTNIFQYIVGLHVLSEQLVELGFLDADSHLSPTWVHAGRAHNNLVPLIESMFESTGDQLAHQYAGTAAHKKYSSGPSGGAGHETGGILRSGKELFISISRHYSSSFTDVDKQNAYNLLLGVYEEFMDHRPGVYEDVSEIEGIDRFAHFQRRESAERGVARLAPHTLHLRGPVFGNGPCIAVHINNTPVPRASSIS